LIADLHIHSHYSRATGRQLNLEQLDLWADYKGITILGTGDCTHPGWLAEMAQRLQPAESGMYTLKPELRLHRRCALPSPGTAAAARFVITGEVSSIYKKNGLTRKVHTLVLLPSLQAADKLSRRLGALGNVTSDGRPILGLDAKHVLEVVLETDPDSLVIPAHIWTPWFSVLGSKSGFDSLEECYEDLVGHISALETGLSSDPPMNWRLSSLDRYVLVSNSDAHSPQKIGREANLLDIELSYPALAAAIKTKEGFLGTLEFFPDEGKYHLDGHRKCEQRLEPSVSKKFQGRCPTCGRPLTLGVLHRVLDLADRPDTAKPASAKPYYHLIPLPEILAEVLQCGPATKKVEEFYFRLLEKLGSELEILRHTPLPTLAKAGGALLGAGIDKMRREKVHIHGGYDGEYGTIRLFSQGERQELTRQAKFWEVPKTPISSGDFTLPDLAPHFLISENRPAPLAPACPQAVDDPAAPWLQRLNPAQVDAVCHSGSPLLVQAGPGTGKTRTLTHRVAHLLHHGIKPEQVLAVTFTRQAAFEMTSRLHELLGSQFDTAGLTIKTFHALGIQILSGRDGGSRRVAEEEERRPLLQEASRQGGVDVKTLDSLISRSKQDILYPADLSTECPWLPAYRAYEELLAAQELWDFDDLVAQAMLYLGREPKAQVAWRQRYAAILVDEYQDLNRAQYELLRLLAPADHTNLFAIGDPNQAIYGFRGACPDYFSSFTQDWPAAKIISLAETYRLPSPILNLARKTLAETALPEAIPLRSLNSSDLPPVLLESANAQAEATQIAALIDYLMGGGSHLALEDERLRYAGAASHTSFKDFAVLYRFHALGQVAQKHLEAAGIPCQLAREAAGPEFTGIDFLAEKVTLLTLHAAKGLEFPYVFIIGCEDGLLPYEPLISMEVDPEEERRLIYVGLTRASRQLFLSCVRQRYLWGQPGTGQLSAWVRACKAALADSPLKKLRSRSNRSKQRALF
jgi:ATP-dependent DNA helicase UvrD/PcrA